MRPPAPAFPQAQSGGQVSLAVWPMLIWATPQSQPRMTCPLPITNSKGFFLSREESNFLPSRKVPTQCTVTLLPGLGKFFPSPGVSVSTCSPDMLNYITPCFQQYPIRASPRTMRSQSLNPRSSTYINMRRKHLTDLSFLNQVIASKAQHIDLNDNYLAHVEEFAGYQFRHLVSLSICNGFLSDVGGLGRAQFPQLEKLHLYGNEIKELAPLAAMAAPKLAELKLGFNYNGNKVDSQQIEQLMREIKTEQLAELCLDCNQIDSLNFLFCRNYDRLTLLYMSGNRLQSVGQSILHLPNIRVLSLKHNFITSLHFMSKAVLPQLQHLNVSDNLIMEVHGLERGECPNLTRIALHDNCINDFSLCFKCNWLELSELITLGAKYFSVYDPNLLHKINRRFSMVQ